MPRMLTVAMILMVVPAIALAQATEHELWSPYWNVADGFQSALQMKNNLGNEPLDVEVSAYLAGGGEYDLGTYHLQPRETMTLELNRAIERVLPEGSRETWGNLEVKFTSEDSSALMGSISVTNPEAGIAWNFRLYATDPELAGRPLRGVFWLPNTQAEGFVAVQNTSEAETSTVSARLIVNGASIAIPPFDLPPGNGRSLPLREYLKAAGYKDDVAGGIELTSSPEGALVAHGALFDMHGFSAEVDMRPELGDGQSKDLDVADATGGHRGSGPDAGPGAGRFVSPNAYPAQLRGRAYCSRFAPGHLGR